MMIVSNQARQLEAVTRFHWHVRDRNDAHRRHRLSRAYMVINSKRMSLGILL